MGRNFGSVRQCYSEGLVSSGTSSQSVGGFIGQYLEGQDCVECASWTAISTGESSSLVGGFIGQREGYDSSGIISCYWDIETSGISDPEEGFPDTDGIAGLPTTQMQTQSTFTGWDFVDEVLNGTDDIWAVCEGTNYPRLVWQIPTGDFVCPDGVSAEDMQFLAARWLDTDYGTVEGAELSGDGFVGVEDIMAVAEYWLAIDCGDCDGRDVTGDGNVNMADLAYISQRWSMSEYGNCDGAELTGDGKIDLADLAVFAGNWLSGVE